MPETSASRRTPLIAWFLGFGVLDSATALVLGYVFHVGSPIVLYLLPPLSLFGDDPDGGTVLDAILVFGGSFVLYGLLGVLLGLIVRSDINFRSPD
jgi:hypothetical protein